MNRLQTILFSMIAFSAVAEFRPPGTAEIPSRQQRSKTTLGVLRNPQKQQAVIDFYPYLSDLAYETIHLPCGEVRALTDYS